MYNQLSRVRASFRYIVSGAVFIIGCALILAPKEAEGFTSYLKSDTAIVSAIFIILSYVLGQPVSRASGTLIEKTYAFVLKKRTKRSREENIRAYILEKTNTGEARDIVRSLNEDLGFSSLNDEQLSNIRDYCKMSVWHSGSKLWDHLDEREQLISFARDTCAPLVLLGVGVVNLLAVNEVLTLRYICTAVIFVAIVIWQGFYREHKRIDEAKEMLLTYYIVFLAHDGPGSSFEKT